MLIIKQISQNFVLLIYYSTFHRSNNVIFMINILCALCDKNTCVFLIKT